MIRTLLTLILLTTTSLLAQAVSPDWTALLDKQSPPAILEKLDASGKDFYAAFSAQTAASEKGYILILHGASQHPAWPYVINPLRLALPKYGWNTFSIELPEVKEQASDQHHAALLDQASAHILSAQAFLQNKGAKRIVLVAYGLGARMAVDWLSKTPQSAVQALVLISMADGKKDSGIDTNQELLKINIPVLDVYAEHDMDKVIQAASERKHHRNRMSKYRQLEIFAADQYYSQLENELIKRVRGWLQLTLKNQ